MKALAGPRALALAVARAADRARAALAAACGGAVLVAALPAAHAACLADADAALLVARYMARKPAPNPEGHSAADGECTRAKVNHFLEQQYGKPIGYKAGLTNPAVQKRFNHDSPVWGVLYRPMLLADGAKVPAGFGARPLFEADLLVRVSDAKRIAAARTPADVLRGIDQVIPFIELPDLVVEAPPKLDGAAISAINVGARLGVTGKPIPVRRQPGFADALRDMQVVLKGDGTELDKGKGSDVLGHPLNVLVWLVQDLARNGRALRNGDLVSLGSFSKLLPPKPGLVVQVQYLGLPGDPVVGLQFE